MLEPPGDQRQLNLPVALPHLSCYRSRVVASSDLLPVLPVKEQTEGQMRGATRRELVAAISGRYQTAARGEKQKILHEFVALTSYHRKYAVRILGAGSADDEQTAPVQRPCRYDEAVREALVLLWEASDRICGSDEAADSDLVGSMERHGHLRRAQRYHRHERA